MNAIEFNNVSKKFKKGEQFDSLRDLIPNLVKTFIKGNGKNGELHEKEFWALKDVSFEVKKGEVLGIIGPNGAGKSTILKLLSQILKPSKGVININGKLSALIEVGAGFHEDLTGRENVYLNGAIMGMKRLEIDRKFDSIIEFSELNDFIDTPVKRYSSGMYVRLGFSVAAHMDPEVLLIDEVLAVGDVSFQRKCIQRIQDMRNSGVTIIFISHNLEVVRRLCPNSILLQHGSVTFSGKSEHAIEHYLKCVNERFAISNVNLTEKSNKESEPIVSIEKIRLCDEFGTETDKFKTGEYLRIEISYLAHEEIIDPTFTVGFVSNDQTFSDQSTRFENFDIKSINGKGRINLIVKNLLLLPGFYEARVHIADQDALGLYHIKSITFFVSEGKRGQGLYYQPHYWMIDNTIMQSAYQEETNK